MASSGEGNSQPRHRQNVGMFVEQFSLPFSPSPPTPTPTPHCSLCLHATAFQPCRLVNLFVVAALPTLPCGSTRRSLPPGLGSPRARRARSLTACRADQLPAGPSWHPTTLPRLESMPAAPRRFCLVQRPATLAARVPTRPWRCSGWPPPGQRYRRRRRGRQPGREHPAGRHGGADASGSACRHTSRRGVPSQHARCCSLSAVVTTSPAPTPAAAPCAA